MTKNPNSKTCQQSSTSWRWVRVGLRVTERFSLKWIFPKYFSVNPWHNSLLSRTLDNRVGKQHLQSRGAGQGHGLRRLSHLLPAGKRQHPVAAAVAVAAHALNPVLEFVTWICWSIWPQKCFMCSDVKALVWSSGLNHNHICGRCWTAIGFGGGGSGVGLADHVGLHFGLLGPDSSWCSVLEAGDAVACAHSSSHLLPPGSSAYGLFTSRWAPRWMFRQNVS